VLQIENHETTKSKETNTSSDPYPTHRPGRKRPPGTLREGAKKQGSDGENYLSGRFQNLHKPSQAV